MGIRDAFCALRDFVRPGGSRLRNPEAFFAAVRRLTGKLDQTQVDTINGLLKAASHWPTGWLAYGLATAWHECRLRPIKELGGREYLHRMYDIDGDRPDKAEDLGNVYPGDGARFAGRGLVQLTGRSNYEKAGKYLGVNLAANPDLALRPKYATAILVWGMEGGEFTGRSLSDYFPLEGGAVYSEFVNARRIINGTDKRIQIADYADAFQKALIAGGWEA